MKKYMSDKLIIRKATTVEKSDVASRLVTELRISLE
jgi:hypothetical protein